MYGNERSNPNGSDRRTTLDHYQGIQRQLDGDIYSTNNEIKVINSKIYKYNWTHPETTTTILNSTN